MKRQVQVTVLVENTAGGDLLAEHGLAFWIETPGRRVLFDTGRGQVLAGNCEKLGHSLAGAEAIVLSHGHYDHTGGLGVAMSEAEGAAIYLHPAATRPKFTRRKDGTGRPAGMPEGIREQLLTRDRLVWTDQATDVGGGLMATGAVPRVTDYEDTGGRFFADDACTRPDPLEDDQAVWFDTDAGLVVLLGCAHAGVINTLLYIGQATGGRHVHAVLGGMHLVNASEERVSATAEALAELNPDVLGPCHCTGSKAVARLWARFEERCVECRAGSRFTFG